MAGRKNRKKFKAGESGINFFREGIVKMNFAECSTEEDFIKNNILNKKLVIYEDCLRDGAQAKTILSLEQRRKVAFSCVKLFGIESYKQLVLVLGYPPICKEEAEICKQLASELPELSVQVVCRANAEEIELCAKTLEKSRHPRILLIIPGSEQISKALTNKSLKECLEGIYATIAEAAKKYPQIKFDTALADVTRKLTDAVIDFALKNATRKKAVSLSDVYDIAKKWV